MYFFKGLIKCMKCGKNYRGNRERKKKVYICSGYANYGLSYCERHQIEEEELLDTIRRHLFAGDIDYSHYTEKDLANTVKSIEANGEEVTIFYKDGNKSIWSPNKLIY